MSQTGNEPHPTRAGKAGQPPLVPSPFDPFLKQLLTWAAEQPQGFSQATATTAAAADFGWQPAFADAIFTSARVRGLLGPYYGRGSRGRSLWAISKRGRSWLQSPLAEDEETAATRR